jgi:hypothetical protein
VASKATFGADLKNPCFFAEGGEKEEKSRGKKRKSYYLL